MMNFFQQRFNKTESKAETLEQNLIRRAQEADGNELDINEQAGEAMKAGKISHHVYTQIRAILTRERL